MIIILQCVTMYYSGAWDAFTCYHNRSFSQIIKRQSKQVNVTQTATTSWAATLFGNTAFNNRLTYNKRLQSRDLQDQIFNDVCELII